MNKIFHISGMLFILSVMAFILSACNNDYEKQILENFSDNGENEPYALKVPLEEMDFEVYSKYFSINSAPIKHNYDRKILLPCDIEYYSAKGDPTPALTLEEGTAVYVMSSDENLAIGYGLQCWPDYEEGWRYGKAFLMVDFSSIPDDMSMYYVRSAQIEKVAEAFYESNRKQLSSSVTKKKYVKSVIQYIDRILYDNGAYISNFLLGK